MYLPLPSISKVYEKVVHDQLMEYSEQNKLSDNNQRGFRTGRSVVTAAGNFIESIVDSVDNGECTIVIFMDLNRAFNLICKG